MRDRVKLESETPKLNSLGNLTVAMFHGSRLFSAMKRKKISTPRPDARPRALDKKSRTVCNHTLCQRKEEVGAGPNLHLTTGVVSLTEVWGSEGRTNHAADSAQSA